MHPTCYQTQPLLPWQPNLTAIQFLPVPSALAWAPVRAVSDLWLWTWLQFVKNRLFQKLCTTTCSWNGRQGALSVAKEVHPSFVLSARASVSKECCPVFLRQHVDETTRSFHSQLELEALSCSGCCECEQSKETEEDHDLQSCVCHQSRSHAAAAPSFWPVPACVNHMVHKPGGGQWTPSCSPRPSSLSPGLFVQNADAWRSL